MELVLYLLAATIVITQVYGVPLSTEAGATQSPTIPPLSLKKLSQNASRASLESWQSAVTLLSRIEDDILAGYEIPPSPTCFQEERDPRTYEHPHPNTDFQAYLVKDYNSLLSYRDYFNDVVTVYDKQLSPVSTRSPQDESSPANSGAIYIIVLDDFVSSLNALLVQMEKLLSALSPTTAPSAAEMSPSTTTLPPECLEVCYGQQVSVLQDYLVLVYNYIPSDISGQSDSKTKNWTTI